MGPFATTVEFYRHREPYPAEFFSITARHLKLTRQTRLLDVGCGPGNLVLGFAPFVGHSTAIDREPQMVEAARAAAAEAELDITFVKTAIEDLNTCENSFDFVTIGRALHWLNRHATLPVLERVIADGGRIAVCGSSPTKTRGNAWEAKFREVRRAWASDPDESRYKPDMDAWFAPSQFRRMDEITVPHRHRVSIDDLIGRALSSSITSPTVLGERRGEFEAAMRTALGPFATEGAMDEEVAAKATVFARRP